MKSLVAALALLLVVGVANSSRSGLIYGFKTGHTYIYALELNTSSGITELDSQISKWATSMTVNISAADDDKIVVKVGDVKTSGSIKKVGSLTHPVEMTPNPELQKHFKKPFQAYIENGKVKNFTLDKDESLASAEIKRAILRCLETHLNDEAVESGIQPGRPITYDNTRTTPLGEVQSHYTLLTSPYPDFPEHHSVVNMTRYDNYADIPYLSYFFHHNMEQQGCPNVCKKNQYKTGCPPGHEQYQTPSKQSFVQHHNFIKINENLRLDSSRSIERHSLHVGENYIEVRIEMAMTRKHTVRAPIEEPTGQRTHTNLYDWSTEAREEVINKHCHDATSEDIVQKAKELLDKITQIIIDGDIDGEVKEVGVHLEHLKRVFNLFEYKHFEKFQQYIVNHDDLPQSTEEEKIRRQLWLEMLPLIGTSRSHSFLVDYIKENINDKGKVLSVMEATDMLEATPLNIQRPTVEHLQKLEEIPKAYTGSTSPGHAMCYYASKIAAARLIRVMKAISERRPEYKDSKSNYLQMLLKETDDRDKNSRSLKVEAEKFVEEIAQKLKEITKSSSYKSHRSEMISLMHALSQTNEQSAIRPLSRFVRGESLIDTPSFVNFVRTVALNNLHNLVHDHSEKVKQLVMPICFNKTEPPKVRISACDVWLKTDLSIDDIQFAAEETHDEQSREVLSYWKTTMETYGNSTQPCDQKRAHNIKKVWPQVKKYDGGKNHAQNIKQTYSFPGGNGFEHNLKYTPNNESFIPSILYGSLKTHTDNFIDILLQLSLNVQGLNSHNMWDNIQRYLNIRDAQHIPKFKEHQIFPQVKIADRANEFWRFTIFQRMLYTVSYYYMDGQDFEYGDFLSYIEQDIKHKMTMKRDGEMQLKLVKVYMGGSYRQQAFANTLRLPVESYTVEPTLVVVDFHAKPKDGGYIANFNPWISATKIHSASIVNVEDCKKVGSYHVSKISAGYPIRLNVQWQDKNLQVSYVMEQLPRKIFTYSSEPYTFATPHNEEPIPSSSERSIIKTIPYQIVKNSTIDIPVFPDFEIGIVTEDASYKIPRTYEQYLKALQNPKWQRLSWDVRRVPNPSSGPNTEVEIQLNATRSYVEKQEHSKEDSSIHAINHSHDEKNFASDEHKMNDQFQKLSHFKYELAIGMKHSDNNQVSKESHVVITHKKTCDGQLHSVSINCTAERDGKSHGAFTRAVLLFRNIPNVLSYGEEYGDDQRAVALFSSKFTDQDKPSWAGKATFGRRNPVDFEVHSDDGEVKHIEPETHEECLRDVNNGKADSVACMKAKREKATFNEGNVTIIWSKDIKKPMRNALARVQLLLEQYFADNLRIEYEDNKPKAVRINWNYQDKLTDNPVYNVDVITPTQRSHYDYVQLPIQPPSSIYSWVDTYIQHHTNNTYPATCSLMEDYIRTYDLKTYRFSKDKSCSYVFTAHCVEHKNFAVIVKIEPTSKTAEVHTYLGRDKIVLKAIQEKEGEYEVHVNNQVYTVSRSQPIMLNKEQEIYAVVHAVDTETSRTYLKLVGNLAGLELIFDGKQLKTQVHPKYKGELCGLCSEFNGEIVNEFRGLDKCLYSHEEDFIRSNALGKCHSSEPIHKSICNEEDYKRSDKHDDGDDETDKDEPKRRKNISERS